MATSFRDLKRNREKMFETLNAEMAKQASGGRTVDERVWYPAVDKAGNGYAVIRFLPPAGDETVPYVREWTHGFKAKGGWYIEKSLTTLSQPDPVSEYNQKMWAEANGNKELEKKVSARKRNLSYWSNVYIVKDPANPDNEGKVKLFRYGKKIYDMLQDKMNPSFPGEVAINPFDLFEGANLVLKIRTEKKTADNPKGFRNYDKSEFEPQGPLFEDEDKMEEVWKQEYPLKDIVDPKQFKTYAELKARFDLVMGFTSAGEQAGETAEPRQERTSTPREKPAWEGDEAAAEAAPSQGGDEDDLEYYRRLAEQQ